MFYYSITLKSTLRNLFGHYSSEISNKFPSFLLFITATLQRAAVHELLMRLHIDVRETLKRNVYFWKRLLCRAMLAELCTMEYLSVSHRIALRKSTIVIQISIIHLFNRMHLGQFAYSFRKIHLTFDPVVYKINNPHVKLKGSTIDIILRNMQVLYNSSSLELLVDCFPLYWTRNNNEIRVNWTFICNRNIRIFLYDVKIYALTSNQKSQ